MSEDYQKKADAKVLVNLIKIIMGRETFDQVRWLKKQQIERARKYLFEILQNSSLPKDLKYDDYINSADDKVLLNANSVIHTRVPIEMIRYLRKDQIERVRRYLICLIRKPPVDTPAFDNVLHILEGDDTEKVRKKP